MRIAMIAMTTSSSISVKAFAALEEWGGKFHRIKISGWGKFNKTNGYENKSILMDIVNTFYFIRMQIFL